MGDVTKIEWADRTFNPWIGCAKISPACDNCYADALMGTAGRYGRATWGGPGKGDGTRTRTAPANWAKARKWQREIAAKILAWISGGRIGPKPTCFVFCSSLADVFDNAVDPSWRRDLFDLIAETPDLTWLLLTKRPGNIVKLFYDVCDRWPRNAAIGCTIANQEEADRDIPKLQRAKAVLNPAFAFLSMEPLLGPVNLKSWLIDGIDWIIVGGESGPNARPMDLDWARDLRDQAKAADVVFNFKQVGGRTADKGGHLLDGREHLDRPRVAA